MPSSFEHTLRSIDRRKHWTIGLAPCLATAAAWIYWISTAELAVYATTERARVEVRHAPSHVAADSAGRIDRLAIELNTYVERGDTLLTLDGSVLEAKLAEQLARLEIAAAKRQGIEGQLNAEINMRKSSMRLAELSARRAELNLRKAEVTATHQAELTHMEEQLQREQLSARSNMILASGERLRSELAVADAATERERLDAEHDHRDKATLTRMAELQRQLVELAAERVSAEAAIATARVELARLRIVAPVSGVIGQLAPLQLGDIVQPGQQLATIVPAADMRVVAQFRPADAVGLVTPGQAARVRLDGFSWIEWGALDATVLHAASEPQEGLVRVELQLESASALPIPVQHGQTASVDVQTDRATAWSLLRRSLGARMVAQPAQLAYRVAR